MKNVQAWRDYPVIIIPHMKLRDLSPEIQLAQVSRRGLLKRVGAAAGALFFLRLRM